MFHRKSLPSGGAATTPAAAVIEESSGSFSNSWRASPSDHSSATTPDKVNEVQALASWDRHEQDVKRKQAQQVLQGERNPRRTVLHQAFRCLCFCTATAAFLMGCGQVVGLILTTENARIDVLSCVMRAYVVAFCALVILNECTHFFTHNSWILRYWPTRGLLYAFVGVIGLQQNDHATAVEPYLEMDSPSLRFIKTVAWLMVAVGVAYTALGALCMQFVYQRVQRDYQQRLQRAQHVRSIEQNLLHATGV